MSNSQSDSSDASRSTGPWPKTLWTVVIEASHGDSPASQEALRRLCRIYHQPIVSWLLRWGYGQDAGDLAGGFVEYLLERNRLEHFSRGEARFRSFLLKCLKGFLRDEWQKRTAEKRGGSVPHVDFAEAEPGTSPDLQRVVDTEFAMEVHRQTLAILEERFRKAGRVDRFNALRRFVLGQDSSVRYEMIGKSLDIKANAVKKAVFDLRDDYCEIFREIVLETVSRGAAEEEMRYLLTLIAQSEAANAG